MTALRYRPRKLLFLFVSYAIWASVTIRWITEYIEQQHPLIIPVSAMLILFGLLLGLEPWITRGSDLRSHLYLIFQTSLVFIASLFYFQLDFFALLYLPLCGQAMFLFSRRTAYIWVVVLILVTFIGQLNQFGWPEGLSFIFLYIAALIFVAAYSTLTIQAEQSRQRSEELLIELQAAHKQLQEYAGQAEELAVAKERNRLARELHDSVTQTLYGLTLQSEAASRQLTKGHLKLVADYLREIKASAQESLQETRLLIFELRPPLLEEEGFAAAIRSRLESIESRSGLNVILDVQDDNNLSEDVENSLYRIAQEALNNILKHARAQQVRLELFHDKGKQILQISDDGRGFDPDLYPNSGTMGLTSMRERAQQIGGELQIHSTPGKGTTIRVEVPL